MVMKTRSSSRNVDESPSTPRTPYSLKSVNQGVSTVDNSPQTPYSFKSVKRGASSVDDSPLPGGGCLPPLKMIKQGPAKHDYALLLESPTEKVMSSTITSPIMTSPTKEPDSLDPTTWQIFHPTTKSKLSYLLCNKVMADLYFVVGKEGSREEIPAHRFVLAMSSAVFYEMFNGPTPVPDKIEIADCEPEAFHKVLRYIYTEKVAFNSKTVLDMLLIAKQYGVLNLEKDCLEFILKDISGENAFRRLSEAHKIGDAGLVSRCLRTIDQQPSASFSAKEFVDASLDDLCRVLARSSLDAPEIVVFRAAKRWAEAECKRQDLLVTPVNQRQVLSRALFLIRFPLMTIEEFGKEVAFSNLLTEKETLQIFNYLSGNPKTALEPFLCEPRVGKISQTRICLNTGCFSNREETLYFELCFYVRANHRIHVDGFGFGQSNTGGVSHQIKVSLKRTCGEVLSSCEKTFTTPADGKPNQLLKVLFPSSVEIKSEVIYHVEGSITIRGAGYLYKELWKPLEGVVSLPEYGNVYFGFIRTPTCVESNRDSASHVPQGVVKRLYFHCS